MESLFSTDFCEAEHCFLVAKWYSHRCPLSTLMHGMKQSQKQADHNHSSIRPWWKLRTWKSPILGESHCRNQEFTGSIHPASHHSPPLKFSSLGKIHFMPKSFLISTFRSHYCWQLNQTSHEMQPYLSVREKPSFQTPWPPFHHNLQASVKMYCTL